MSMFSVKTIHMIKKKDGGQIFEHVQFKILDHIFLEER